MAVVWLWLLMFCCGGVSFCFGDLFPDDCPTGCSCTTESSDPAAKKPAGIKVSCVSNQIKDLLLDKLPANTEEIDLSANDIEVIRKTSFPFSASVKKLYIRKNNIKEIEDGAFSNLPSLQRLNLEDNDLVAIYRRTFDGLTLLRHVDLTTNKLKFIDDNAFASTRLRKLLLANNRLITLPSGLRFLSLRNLNVNKNNLLCHCNLEWMASWVKQLKVVVTKDSLCMYPSSMNKVPLTTVASSFWQCADHKFEMPRFQVQPSRSLVFFEEDSVIMACSSIWVPFGQFQWFKDGVRVQSGNGTTVFNDYTNELISNKSQISIDRLDQEHAGTYTCELSVPWNEKLTKQSNLVFFNKLVAFCPSERVTTEKGNFFWRHTAANGVSMLTCPHGSSDRHNEAFRNCSTSGVWEEMETSHCRYHSQFTESLERLSKIGLNRSNIHDVTLKLIRFDPLNVTSVTDIQLMTKILQSFAQYRDSFSIVSTLGAFIFRTVSKIASVSPKLLVAAEREGGYIRSLTTIPFMYAQHAQHSNVKSVHTVANNIALHSSGIPVTRSGLMGWVVRFPLSSNGQAYNDASLNFTDLTVNTTYGREQLDAGVVIFGDIFQDIPHSKKSTSISVSFVAMKSTHLFPETSRKTLGKRLSNTELSSVVVALNFTVPATLRRRRDKPLVVQSVVIFRHLMEGKNPRLVAWRSFQDKRFGWFDVPSCHLNSTNGNYSQFVCNDMPVDMTYLAVAMDVFRNHRPQIFHLEAIIFVGVGICCLTLLLTFVIYAVFREIRYNRSDAATLMNLCLTLAVLGVAFALGINRVDEPHLCRSTAVVLHYCLLSALVWIGCGGLCVHELVKKGRTAQDYYPVLKYYLLGWGIPLIICGITYAGSYDNYAITPYCWLHADAVVGALVGPACFILLIDFIVFIRLHLIISRKFPEDRTTLPGSPLARNRSQRGGHRMARRLDSTSLVGFTFPSRSELHDFLHGSLLVIVLLCFGFGSAIMIFSFRVGASRYLYHAFSFGYAICNALLGVVIIFFHCLKRVDVRRRLRWIVTKHARNQPLISSSGQEEALLLEKNQQVVLQAYKAKQMQARGRTGYNSELTHDQSDAVSGISMATSVFLEANDSSRPSSLIGVNAIRRDVVDRGSGLTTVTEGGGGPPTYKDIELKELDAVRLGKDFPSERDTLLDSDERPMVSSAVLPSFDNVEPDPRPGSTGAILNQSRGYYRTSQPEICSNGIKVRADIFAGRIPVAVVPPYSPPSLDGTPSHDPLMPPTPGDVEHHVAVKSSCIASPISQPTTSDRLSVNSQPRSVNLSHAASGSVPGELASFVPANWKPVRKGGRSASFYPIMDHNQRHLPRGTGTGMLPSVTATFGVTRPSTGSVSSRTTATAVIEPSRPHVQQVGTSNPRSNRSDSRRRKRRKRLDPNRPKFDDIPCTSAVVFIPIPEHSRLTDPLRNETSV